MKEALIIAATSLVLIACSGNGPKIDTYRTLPWECSSPIPPQDAEVIRMEGGRYIYDCLHNGSDGPGGSGGDGGDGDGSE